MTEDCAYSLVQPVPAYTINEYQTKPMFECTNPIAMILISEQIVDHVLVIDCKRWFQ